MQTQALEVTVFSGFQIVLPFGSVFSGFPSTVAIPRLACFSSAGICFSCQENSIQLCSFGRRAAGGESGRKCSQHTGWRSPFPLPYNCNRKARCISWLMLVAKITMACNWVHKCAITETPQRKWNSAWEMLLKLYADVKICSTVREGSSSNFLIKWRLRDGWLCHCLSTPKAGEET